MRRKILAMYEDAFDALWRFWELLCEKSDRGRRKDKRAPHLRAFSGSCARLAPGEGAMSEQEPRPVDDILNEAAEIFPVGQLTREARRLISEAWLRGQSDAVNGAVRVDIGGWISGPCE